MKTKLLISVLALLLLPVLVQATHLVSSYISYAKDPLDPRRFNFTLTVYTNHYSQAEDPEVVVIMGDGNTAIVPRESVTRYSSTLDKEIFRWSYTYITAGQYTVAWVAQNRDNNILNIPAPSDQVPAYTYANVKADILVTNMHGPTLAGVPLLQAYSGEPMTHNLLAYDADGDQLHYDLIPPKTQNRDGTISSLPGYQFPEGLTVDNFGELRWENPGDKGKYVANLLITEKRNGQVLGSTVVDLVFNVIERTVQPEMSLVNKERLTVNYDGTVLARPNQPLKMEYYLQRTSPDLPLSLKQFGELDTLNLATPVLAVRDTVDGLAVTLTFTPTANLMRPEPYLLGIRGRANGQNDHNARFIEDDWAFAYLVVGEQQPTSSEDDLAEAGFTLYPNPVADQFIIEAPSMPNMQVQLFDATGKAVAVLLLKPGRNRFSKPATAANGLYFYTISSRNKPIGSGRLVVQ